MRSLISCRLVVLFSPLLFISPLLAQAPVDFGVIDIDPFTEALGTAIADIDGDGDNDVLFSKESGWMSWFENTSGDGLSFTEHVVQANMDSTGHWWQSWSVFTADIDNDGDQDIIGGTGGPMWGNYNQYEVNWWENTAGDGSSWTRHTIDDEDRPNWMIILYWAEPGDIDGDGDIDLAVGNYDTILWYEQGTSGWTRHVLDTNFKETRGAHPVDLDGDGDMEIVGCAYYDSEVAVYDAFTGAKTVLTTLSGAWSVISLDADGDGDWDLAASGTGVLYLENTGSGFNVTTIQSYGGGYSIRTGDFDGDGSPDLVCSHEGKWYHNNGSGTGWTTWSLPIYNALCGAVGDIDGDGDDDISCSPYYEGLLWLGNEEDNAYYDPYGGYYGGGGYY